jgi:hypothetical protein
VDQLKAWNANLLQRMMSEQRHRRNSMTNLNASLAHTSACVRRNISNSNIIINDNSDNASSVSNSLNNHHHVHAISEMPLHSLLVVPRKERLAKQKRGVPEFSSTSSLRATGSVNIGAVDGDDSNSMLSNTNNMPYRSFLRRDSLCGFKQLQYN